MADGRSRAFTRGVHVSGLGGQSHRLINGVHVPRLEAVPKYAVHFEVDAGVATAQDVGLLAAGTYVSALINHLALTGGTVAVSLIDPAGVAAAINFAPALALSAVASNTTGAFLTPLAQDRLVRVTVTGGTSGETAIMSLDVGVLRPDWN